MRRTLLYMLTWLVVTVQLLVVIGFWLFLLPFRMIIYMQNHFTKTLRDSYKTFLSLLPEEVRTILPGFDINGLRHNITYLNQVEVRNQVAVMPVEKQCEFVDEVTYKMYPKDRKTPGYNPMPETFPVVRQAEIEDFDDINFSAVNTTDIGNMAWLSLHHPVEEFRTKAAKTLLEIHEYFKQFNP